MARLPIVDLTGESRPAMKHCLRDGAFGCDKCCLCGPENYTAAGPSQGADWDGLCSRFICSAMRSDFDRVCGHGCDCNAMVIGTTNSPCEIGLRCT